MHPAIAPVPPAAAPQAPQQPAPSSGAHDLQFAQLSPGPLPAASAQDQAAFTQASARGAPHEVQAEAPGQEGGIGSRLMHQMEQLTHRLSGMQAGAAPGTAVQPAPAGQGAPGPHASGFDHAGMDGAIAQIERAYMFAIETTMVSRGSTESTKIFNTLLKGQ